MRPDASVIARWTTDRTLLAPAAPRPRVVDDIPLTDPTQQWWDLLDLGGEDRREAADRLRAAIMAHAIPGGARGQRRWCSPASLRRWTVGSPAIADVSQAMACAGREGDCRLIVGVTVMLHIERGAGPRRGTAPAGHQGRR